MPPAPRVLTLLFPQQLLPLLPAEKCRLLWRRNSPVSMHEQNLTLAELFIWTKAAVKEEQEF